MAAADGRAVHREKPRVGCSEDVSHGLLPASTAAPLPARTPLGDDGRDVAARGSSWKKRRISVILITNALDSGAFLTLGPIRRDTDDEIGTGLGPRSAGACNDKCGDCRPGR